VVLISPWKGVHVSGVIPAGCRDPDAMDGCPLSGIRPCKLDPTGRAKNQFHALRTWNKKQSLW